MESKTLKTFIILIVVTYLTSCTLIKNFGAGVDCLTMSSEDYPYDRCYKDRANHPESITVKCKKIKKIEDAEGVCSQLVD